MTLHHITNAQELSSFKSSHSNTLICYSATWCGPCQRSKPELTALAARLSSDKQCDFALAHEEDIGDEIHKAGIRAFPTYVLYQEHGRIEGGRIQGVNLAGVEDLVKSKCGSRDPFVGMEGTGRSLSGAPVGNSFEIANEPVSPEEARNRRLARFGGNTNTVSSSVSSSVGGDGDGDGVGVVKEESQKEEVMKEEETEEKGHAVKDQDMVDVSDDRLNEEKSNEEDVVMKNSVDVNVDATDTCTVVEMIDPTEKLDKDLVEQLTSSMGFSLIRAQKGLLNSNGTMEGAVEWLLAHQEDADIDDPIEKVPTNSVDAKAQSYLCNQCGKILSNMANLELHANKTGHSDFQESTQAVKPLTAEEKAEKVKKIKELLAKKRAEREECEKKDNVTREKQRRFMGKEIAKTREEMEIEKRKRDAYLRKKQKEEARKERERIRAELAKDKAERAANKGKLNSRLGVDGYNPSAIQYEVGPDGKPIRSSEGDGTKAKVAKIDSRSASVKVDDCIKKISSYRAGGDGGKCLKILLAYVKNVADSDEEKFKTINMTNKAYVGRVKPFVGAKALLLAVGFSPNDSNDALKLSPDANKGLLIETKAKLEKALASY